MSSVDAIDTKAERAESLSIINAFGDQSEDGNEHFYLVALMDKIRSGAYKTRDDVGASEEFKALEALAAAYGYGTTDSVTNAIARMRDSGFHDEDYIEAMREAHDDWINDDYTVGLHRALAHIERMLGGDGEGRFALFQTLVDAIQAGINRFEEQNPNADDAMPESDSNSQKHKI